MPKFQCKKCNKTIEREYVADCGPEIVRTMRNPECCGETMIELIDY
ncbi:MAG: hypothetical protein ACXADA_10915 [Candidatus Hodarchaeales archaeon]